MTKLEKWNDPYHQYMNWALEYFYGLKPGSNNIVEKEALSAAYRRYGAAGKDIIALARGDVELAKKGTLEIGRFMQRIKKTWKLDTVARWFCDWHADPEYFQNGTR